MEFSQKSLVRLLIFVLILIFSTRGDEDNITNYESNYRETYANRMKSYMNLSVDPCDDFYEYACGNYREDSPLVWLMLEYKYAEQTDHLEGKEEHLLGSMDLAKSLNVSKELRVAQKFYNACLEADLHPFPAADPHYLALIRSIGGFPAVDGANWNASNFSWFNMSAHMINYGAEGLIHDQVNSIYPFSPDLVNPKIRLGFEYVVNMHLIGSNISQLYQPYKELMGGYLRSFQLTEDRIAEVIDGVFAFWREALEVDENYEISGNCEIFEDNYFKIVWNRTNVDRRCDSFFVELDKVCARHPEAVANYLALKLLYTFDAKVDPRYHRDYCDETLRSSMAFLFNKLYIAEHFTEEIKLEVSEIVEEVRKSLRRSIQRADWFDSYYQYRPDELLKKTLFDFTQDEWLSDRIIPEIGRLEIVEDSYAATNINLQRLIVDINRYNAHHPEDLSESSKLPNEILDDIAEIATFLKPPIYHPSWPLSLKFGALGSYVGRKILDNSISGWFSGERFHARNKCFLDHYNEFVNLHNDTKKGFEILPFGQLETAFSAYKWHIISLLVDYKEHKINETMPGLEMTPDQLFFLGSTQIFCADIKDAKYLAVSSLMSNWKFFHAFGCPEGSGMRPKEEFCILW